MIFRFAHGAVALMAILLLTEGCAVRKPQPSTWWGVRQIREKTTGREREPRRQPSRRRGADRQKAGPTNAYGSAPDVEADYHRAINLVKEHKFTEAKQLLRSVLERHPRHSEAFRWLGDCHYNLLELPEAIEAYENARRLDPENYFALRGKGFALLHHGHELWRRREPDQAHEAYRDALGVLQQCLRVFPADSEAMYGRAMAAEGATRKLYANAVRLMREGNQSEAEVVARNCLEVIDEGIEAGKFRINVHLDEPGPRALVAGLFYRRAMLLKEFGRTRAAITELGKAIDTQRSILSDVDENNPQARSEIEKYQRQMEAWRTEAGS